MKKIIIALIIVTLGVTPLLTQGNLYFMGGDDMRLYYLYPKEYIQNLLLNIVTDNSISGGNMGYYPATHPVPLVAIMWLVKTIVPANTQFVMYGLNWAVAFLFFYLLLGLWIEEESSSVFFIKIIASLFYIFSPFLINTFYKHQMIVIYLIAATPGVLYFFIKSVRSRNSIYVFTASLTLSILSTNLSSLPWTIPVFITSLPILISEFISSKKTFIFHSLLFVASYALLNMSWIFHLVYLTIHNTGLTTALGTYTTEEFLKTNIAGILGTSRLFSPLNGVVNQLNSNLAKSLSFISYANLIFMSIVVGGGMFLSSQRNRKIVNGYIVGLLGLLFSWLLMTPNFGNWGPNLFLFLSLKVPFFTMFRNMFDKFSLPLAMYYAFVLAIGLTILTAKITSRKLQLLVLVTLVIIIGINAYPLFTTRVEHVGVQAKLSGTFNDDFTNLAAYFLNLKNPSRILWLPLNYPSFVNVEDKYLPGHFYSGPSPLRLISNRQDYAGQYSFIASTNITIGDEIFPMIDKKNYEEFGRLVQLRNARYVILDKQDLPATMKPYLYNHYSIEYGKLKMQNDEFINSLLGKKLQDFGDRYSVYEINPKYNNDRIFLTDDYDAFPENLPNVNYEKISDSTYNITLSNIKNTRKLVFLDSYYRDWTLYLLGPQPKSYHAGKNQPVGGFANGWEIDPEEIKNNFSDDYYTTNPDGSLNLKMSLYFEPAKYNHPIRNISLGSFLVAGGSQLFLVRKKKHAQA